MRPLLSSRQSLELDAHVRQLLDFSTEMLMEIASGKLWEALRAELSVNAEARRGVNRECGARDFLGTSIATVCGKGDNAGDALVMLRRAKIEGFRDCAAYIPAQEELKESARKNLARAERCGVSIHLYDAGEHEVLPLARELSRYDVLLDAVLGTGTRGPASGSAAHAIAALNEAAELREAGKNVHPRIVAVDIPSGLSDTWQLEYPIVRADLTLGIEPLKEALYMPAARLFAGRILPIGGIFPLWTEKSSSKTFLVEAADMELYIPEVSAWDHKMQRGRVAILAGSREGAGAALHCVRGALSSGAGYVALFCDEELLSAYLSMVGDAAIVRAYKENDFSPENWDAIVAGPGWGTDARRSATLKRLLDAPKPLLLDADALRLYAKIAPDLIDKCQSSKRGPLILTPHPGEFRDLLPLIEGISTAENEGASNMSETVRQLGELATRLCAIIALRAATTHIAGPSGSCAIYDGSAFGLGIAGSGDVLAGLAGGLVARHSARLRDLKKGGSEAFECSPDVAMKAVVGAVLVHGISGMRLSEKKGWFTPMELADECAIMTSKIERADAEDGQ